MNRIYVHVPFCASKCGYCAFYSLPSPDSSIIDSYLEKLGRDFAVSAKDCGKIDSFFIGGGTPTYLPAGKLNILFEQIKGSFDISADTEISIECNPETLTSEKARIIAGFANRVSLGAQSFKPKFRKLLGRQGTPGSIEKAAGLLSENGISNIGCDLIYAIPGQTPDDWLEDLEKAVSLPLKHISAYSLTIEEGTLLSKGLSDDEVESFAGDRRPVASSINPGQAQDSSIKMWKLASSYMKKHGFSRYEISNYSKRGCECRHNLEIWYGDGYLGFGPAASSFDGRKRWTNPPELKRWLAGDEPETDIIPSEKRAREIFVMGLRTSHGWDKEYFLRRTGFEIDICRKEIDQLLSLRLLLEDEQDIKCTEKGLLLWNEVAEKLI